MALILFKRSALGTQLSAKVKGRRPRAERWKPSNRKKKIQNRKFYSIQSAMKTLVSPRTLPLRFEAKASLWPSGENMGKPSKEGLKVICSRPVPSVLTAKRLKSRLRTSG